MISKLRKRHRLVTILLSVILPVLLFLALSARVPEPVMTVLPSEIPSSEVLPSEISPSTTEQQP